MLTARGLHHRAVDAGRLGVAWLKAMAWDLRGNLEEETDRALLVPTVRSLVDDLYPPYPYARHDVDRASRAA